MDNKRTGQDFLDFKYEAIGTISAHSGYNSDLG